MYIDVVNLSQCCFPVLMHSNDHQIPSLHLPQLWLEAYTEVPGTDQ